MGVCFVRVSLLNDRDIVYKISQSYEFLNKNKVTIPNDIPMLIGADPQGNAPRQLISERKRIYFIQS